jgi:LmbE family N-acetylglucosaminyl deacetylase
VAEPVPEGPQAPEVPEAGPGTVLAVFAHPDDAEIAAGGSMIRWAEEGREVHLLILTNGDRGSDDPADDRVELARTRVKEQAAAAEVLGLASFEILATPDGELENTRATQAEVVRAIRRLKPAILLSNDPTAWFFGSQYFNHSDHRMAGAVALDATFPGAGNPHFFGELRAEGLEAWKVSEMWLGWTNEPNHYQDITGLMERKLAALAEHASQVKGGMLGFFESWLPMEAEENGRKIGVQHAEAFRRLDLS